jgi:hypothetical protein
VVYYLRFYRVATLSASLHFGGLFSLVTGNQVRPLQSLVLYLLKKDIAANFNPHAFTFGVYRNINNNQNTNNWL